MIPSSLSAGPHQSHSGISEILACDARACDVFMHRLDPQDIKWRFGALHTSIEFFLPDGSAAIPRVTFAASNAAGAIVGILTVAMLSATSVEIGIIVRSDLQGRGIGKALLAHSLDWAAANDKSHVIAFIDHENHRMRALALAAGFNIVGQDEFSIKVIASVGMRKEEVDAIASRDRRPVTTGRHRSHNCLA